MNRIIIVPFVIIQILGDFEIFIYAMSCQQVSTNYNQEATDYNFINHSSFSTQRISKMSE